MKRYIRTSKYLDESKQDYLFDDILKIDIDLDMPSLIYSSTGGQVVRFPGIDRFREDVAHILEDEYNFVVIEDMHDGKVQKGYITNREDSISVYFDTYFDLSNAEAAFKRLGITKYDIPESGKVFCFIHLRFSDHELNDEGDVAHRKFLAENAKKYTADNDEVTHIIPDEQEVVIPESKVYRYYDEALDELRYELDLKVVTWVRRIERYKRH